MESVKFKVTLSESNIRTFSRIITSFSKISDGLDLTIQGEKLIISAFTNAKNAFLRVEFFGEFFDAYEFFGGSKELCCSLGTKEFSSIFRSKGIDNSKANEKDVAIERAEIFLVEKKIGSCHFIVRFFYKTGIVKTIQLSYEEKKALFALYDRSKAINWKANGKLLSNLLDHIPQTNEYLNVSYKDDRLIFTAYSDTKMVSNESKKGFSTTISLDKKDFPEIDIDHNLMLTLHLHEYRVIVELAAKYAVPINTCLKTGFPCFISFCLAEGAITVDMLLSTISEKNVIGSDGAINIIRWEETTNLDSIEHEQSNGEPIALERNQNSSNSGNLRKKKRINFRENGSENLRRETYISTEVASNNKYPKTFTSNSRYDFHHDDMLENEFIANNDDINSLQHDLQEISYIPFSKKNENSHYSQSINKVLITKQFVTSSQEEELGPTQGMSQARGLF